MTTIRFEGNLDVVADGVEMHVSGREGALVIETEDLSAIVDSVRGTSGLTSRRGRAQTADELARAGASIHVSDTKGTHIVLGSDANSGALRLLTGTRHVAIRTLKVRVALLFVKKFVLPRRSQPHRVKGKGAS